MHKQKLILNKPLAYLITIYFVGLIFGIILAKPSNLNINFSNKNYFVIFFSNYWYLFLIWIFGFSIISYFTTSLIVFFRAFIFGILLRVLFLSNFNKFMLMVFIELVFAFPLLIFTSYISISLSKINFQSIFHKNLETINYNRYINLMFLITIIVVIYSLIIYFN